jgi:glycosyl hydrolase family 26
MKYLGIMAIGAAIIAGIAATATAAFHDEAAANKTLVSVTPVSVTLPHQPGSYLGVYADGAPDSYAGVSAFTRVTGVRPDVLLYYSGWLEPFRASFAAAAARSGAVPLVQIDPESINLAEIASGLYDSYLGTYAVAVRSYRGPVILSFGHEMNGSWRSWGYRHTSPATFVAAWRHIVTVFRALGAGNVTWLWTVNVIAKQAGIPAPGPWWPGNSYVTWVGIDGYYAASSMTFASLFGPTIVAVRGLTNDPILIAETGVAPAPERPTKIANLFAGIRTYGLLGLVWFDAKGKQDWRLVGTAAVAAFHRGAKGYHRLAS